MHYTDNLQSARLKTRLLTHADVAAWTAFFKDDQATAYHPNPGNLSPGERAQQWIDFTIARYNNNRLGLQALLSRHTGEFIGQCGLMVQEVNGLPVIEIGYHLLPQYWHHGYATEAARMFRDYGFENGFADTIVSVIHPLNENSKRVAIRNGMTLVQPNAQFRGEEYNLFSITRQEWQKQTKK